MMLLDKFLESEDAFRGVKLLVQISTISETSLTEQLTRAQEADPELIPLLNHKFINSRYGMTHEQHAPMLCTNTPYLMNLKNFVPPSVFGK